MAQTLIDFDILKLFIKGTDEDRATIKKLYPELEIQSLRDELMWSILLDHMRNPRRIYPVNFNGKTEKLVITYLQDEQN